MSAAAVAWRKSFDLYGEIEVQIGLFGFGGLILFKLVLLELIAKLMSLGATCA